jgi:hypothetical protein
MRTRIQTRETKPTVASRLRVKPQAVKILNLAIHLEKLTAQLSDGRELSIPIE